MSLFTRPESRAISWRDVWGRDLDPEGLLTSPQDYATFIPVFAAVRLLSDGVAKTPLEAHGASPGALSPQPRFCTEPALIDTPYVWGYKLMWSLLIRGNAFGAIAGVDRAGWPTAVEWLNPQYVSVVDDEATTDPRFMFKGQLVERGAIVHIPAFPVTGRVLGVSPVRAFASTVGLGGAARKMAMQWLGANGIPGAVLQHKRKRMLAADEVANVKGAYKRAVSGRDLLALGADWDFTTITMPDDEAHFLQVIKASANEVAAIYGVPPDRIGGEATGSRTYANLDMDLRWFRETALAGWYTQIQQALTTISPPSLRLVYNIDAGIRPDTLSRMQSHEIAIRTGVETADEARADEGRAPLTDESGRAGSHSQSRSLALVEAIQKVYLGVGKVLTVSEARRILNEGYDAALDLDVESVEPPPPLPAVGGKNGVPA